MKNKFIILLLTMISFNCFSQTKESGSRYFKASFNNITIDIPDGFEAVPNQNGFLHKGSASTLMINEISNSPYSFTVSHFKPENLEKDGAKVTEMQEIKTAAGQDALLYTLTLTLPGKDNTTKVDFERMVLLTGNNNTTFCVVASYPLIIRDLILEPLKTSMLSVIIN
ncbi:MAG TPA: hypothetical protein PKW80_14240 [Bacteroidales bacterium]|nr:hypothetical protein [Bacteroidales bacterium]